VPVLVFRCSLPSLARQTYFNLQNIRITNDVKGTRAAAQRLPRWLFRCVPLPPKKVGGDVLGCGTYENFWPAENSRTGRKKSTLAMYGRAMT